VIYETLAATEDAFTSMNGGILADLTGNPGDDTTINMIRPVENEILTTTRRVRRGGRLWTRVVDEETDDGTPLEPREEEPAKGRRYLLVREALLLINLRFITQTMVDPENQEEILSLVSTVENTTSLLDMTGDTTDLFPHLKKPIVR